MKPWETAAWKKKRAEFLIGKSCEWCGSTETPLTINHKKNFYSNFERGKLAYQYMIDYFGESAHQVEREEIKKSVIKKMPIVYTLICPDCGDRLQSRNKLKIEYRCSNCSKDVDKPAKRINKNFIHTLNKAFFHEFSALHENEISAKFDPIQDKADKEYLAFKDVMVLCKKDNMLFTKGFRPCPVCKTGYARLGYPKCYNCFLKTEEGKKHIERKEEMRQLEEEDNEDDAKFLLYQKLEDFCKEKCQKGAICKIREVNLNYARDILLFN